MFSLDLQLLRQPSGKDETPGKSHTCLAKASVRLSSIVLNQETAIEALLQEITDGSLLQLVHGDCTLHLNRQSVGVITRCWRCRRDCAICLLVHLRLACCLLVLCWACDQPLIDYATGGHCKLQHTMCHNTVSLSLGVLRASAACRCSNHCFVQRHCTDQRLN